MIKKILMLIFMLTIFYGRVVYSKDAPLTGRIGSEKFTVQIELAKNDKENNNVVVVVEFKGKTQRIKFPGYATTRLTVGDLNGDGNDEVLFNYYQGAKLSDLGLVGYEDNKFKALDAEDYWGPNFDLVPSAQETLVAFREDDGGSCYYYSHLSKLQGNKLVETKSAEAWNSVIQRIYSKWLEKADSNQRKSRIYYYMYMACEKAGMKDMSEKYYEKSSKTMPPEKRILTYYTGGFRDADPDALDDLWESIGQIRDFAKKNHIELKENTKEDLKDPSCTYALASGDRVKRLDGIETGPDLVADCVVFFGLK